MTYFEFYSTLFKRMWRDQFPEYRLIMPNKGYLPTTWGIHSKIQRVFDKILAPCLSHDLVQFFKDEFGEDLTRKDIKFLADKIYNHALTTGLDVTAFKHNISCSGMNQKFHKWFETTICEKF